MFGTSLTGRNDRLNLPCIMHQSNGFAQIPDAEVHYRYSLAREYRLRVTFRCGIQEHSSWNIALLGITHFSLLSNYDYTIPGGDALNIGLIEKGYGTLNIWFIKSNNLPLPLVSHY